MLSKIPANPPPRLVLKFFKMFSHYDDIQRARHLFDKIHEPDLRSWTILISAHTKHGFPEEALNIYNTLRARNVKLDTYVLLPVAKACAASADLIKAREVHDDAIRFGFSSDTLLGNALVDMYAKCKYVDGAKRAFDDVKVKDVVTWTSMASCYANCGLARQCFGVIRNMGLNGVRPNSVTVSSILPACTELKDLNLGREIHGFVVRNAIGENVFVSSALVNMYASCLSVRQAEFVFVNMFRRDSVSWNVLLTAYFSNKEYEKGLGLFHQMRSEGVKLNQASWNAVVGGCVQNGLNEQALDKLRQMQDSRFRPNQITITCVLPACTNLESLKGGKEIHGYICRHWYFKDLTTSTALVSMYAKCGDLDLSRRVFDMMTRKDTVAWNTIIIANSMHGNGNEAVLLFHNMLGSGIKPNSVTFTGVLSGCSHSRLVHEGLQIFNSMNREHSIDPDADHYSCMVDVLSRAGRLEEAYEFIQRMPIEPSAGAWGSLLGACRVYKNVKLGRISANRLFEIEPDNPGNYVLLSNILGTAKLWDEASKTRKLMRDRGIPKTPGCSWVHVRNKIYTFVVGDKSNKQSEEIYNFLEDVGKKMKLAGYIPNVDFVLQDVDPKEKHEILCNHSEKLAVAFGLLNLNGESSIRVFKNLRICGDCHTAIKFMAKIVGVHIIVRDSLRFHHFRDGILPGHQRRPFQFQKLQELLL
ncbi:PPR domain-containing protein/PPR_2 domain-containing protein/DYW_deaminase domain-containing protein [Cephalotus follicularis]|uniref:PPR domain-containing protein/PPR_2 domain-containing protein/DYW_deaminase domain-containing protein n=1 Tax=Cephalotus follicularis TaxID=3775 RepID=A0A1Q3DB39_CEPFO|nr:PPR domain-containing protein/PPR_2 domain-containing protein/DYW_deaminase domain-containing protein [Cephalotus follicularis]